ncbi:oxysterol-binding protein-related protein 2 [Odontomachus brunneus]|uniref:oxysterol-binding protein-related protein 2 n=1 Tax=Odontomachus brunneus TaxID=486640 RepID=UPI0013F1FEF5|nr:oxysterol-binding protein-related protein 2 [Odontomachus brunneus]XP_032690021.1 oxysterol-binding protein-related protein 2 [Odontomachus brunneus]
MASERISGQHRTSLPVPGHSEVNLCSVLSLGKDLSKITMPVIFNEPLSFLQRVAEYMEYARLLKLASQEESSISRLQYVAAFAVSALASNWERLGKPFNPILGETYELEREDFRIICEQVSHHPPVSAFYADSEDFIFHGSIHPKLKFWGKSIEVHPKGVVTVELPKWKEAYTWQNVNCILHNVLVGQLWMEQLGALDIRQYGGDNLKATLAFKSGTWNGKDLHRVEGFITDQEKRKLLFLYGKWTERLRSCEPSFYEEALEKIKREAKSPQGSPGHKKVLAKLHSLKVGAFKPLHQDAIDDSSASMDSDEMPVVDEIPGSTTLWEVTPRPSNSSDYFQFTTFAMSLNELDPDMGKTLCPTDSRLRPDIRKLETGDQDGAATEKIRLEEKQRDTRKARKHKRGHEYVPRWFQSSTNPYTGQEDWLYQGGYWDRNYADVEDIF